MPRKPAPKKTGGEPLTVLLNLFSHRRVWNLPEGRDENLRQRFPDVHFILTADRKAFRENLPRAEVLYSWHLPADIFPLARRLRWMHTPAAGIEHLLHPRMRASDVVLTNCRGLAGDAMAEHALALALALSRRIHDAVRLQSAQRWGQDLMWSTPELPFRLGGRTLGIVGLGGIGLELARRARALGMRVVATRRHPQPKQRHVDLMLPHDKLDELLGESDFVVLTLPLTPETRGLMGPAQFARMKKSAYLVNIGRGELVNENALLRALRGGRIAGAALDVFQNEPLPARSVLWRLPNLLVSPHYAGTYPEHMDRATDLFERNLACFIAGRPLRSVVDKRQGY